MKKQALLFAFVMILGSVVAFSTGALAPDPVAAAPGGEKGPPDGKGPGGGAPDYGDLIILLRDADGVPIPSEAVEAPDPETGELVDGGLCWQPISKVPDCDSCVQLFLGYNEINEEQSISNDAEAGTFTLTFDGQTTNDITWNADASVVEDALELLSTITDVGVTWTGMENDPWVIVFLDPGAQDVPQIEANDDLLLPAGAASTVVTDIEGSRDPIYTSDRRGVPVDPYNCAVLDATYTQEVDFGRINEARSPEDVFASQLDAVKTKLFIADSTSLDPAGRMVASTCGADEDTSTIDSPLQNLAIYRQLLLTGDIGPDLPEGAGILDTAARGLGAASDKSGGVNVDMVAYLNQIMGLTDPLTVTILEPICEEYREEVQGVIQLVEKCFLDYGSYSSDGYAYERGTNFGALPSPKYIPENDPAAGWFEYLVQTNDDPPTFEIEYGSILDAVFGDSVAGVNIGGFAQAADDTRAVIDYMHTNPVPDDYATPVPCIPSGEIFVDVSISDVSGLQVPKNVVDGSSDREFIVYVANAGPDDATVTLEVTAIPEISGIVQADLGNGEFIASPFEFPVEVIPADENHAFSAIIRVEIGEKTTINWKADAASAEFDVNAGNNVVTAVSNVKVTGGGGGGRPPR